MIPDFGIATEAKWWPRVVALIGLAVPIGGLYLHTDGKFDDADQRMDRIVIQAQRIEGKIDTIGAKIDGLRDRREAGLQR